MRGLLAYDENTAGGLMTPDFFSAPASLGVEETIRRIREVGPQAETLHYVYVVDGEGHLVGVVTLRGLMGDYVNGPIFNVVAWVTTVVMIVLSTMLVVTSFMG